MGIQIKGSNDTISAADGSLVLEGVALTFDNENITGISTMATGHITGTATIDDDLKVGISTFFVDKSTGRVGIGTDNPDELLHIASTGTAKLRLTDKRTSISDGSQYGVIQFEQRDSNTPGVSLEMAALMTDTTNGATALQIKTGTPSTITERFRITSGGKVCIGGDTPSTATLNINTQSHYVVTDSGRAANGIHIRGNGGNSGEYGGAISFGCNSDGAAAIAAEQMSSDVDVIGLSFFTRSSSTGSDDATKRVRIPSSGGIELHNWPSNTGLIFRSDASPPTTANVQSSNGRGITSGKNDSIAQNTTTTLGNSHWGGLALIGYSGTGHQGYRLVSYGYGGAGVSVLHSGQWVGSLTTTFSMSTYSLQVSHNASNALSFWLINIGV